MVTTEQRLAELHEELAMLRSGLEFTTHSADRARIFVRLDAAVAEYTQLVNARLAAVLSVSAPLIERSLGHRRVPGVGNELGELPIGDGVPLDREGLDMLVMDRPLVGIELLRAHPEHSSGQLDQIRECPHKHDAS